MTRASHHNASDKRKQAAAAYRKEHGDEMRQQARAYHASPTGQAKRKVYYAAHQEEILRKARESRQRPERKERAKAYRTEAMRRPVKRIERSLRGRLRDVLRGRRGEIDVEALTGCSLSCLRAHLESLWREGMSWENYGVKGWHIDHVKPCASFNLSAPEEQRACFHWSNLQPMWASENKSKGDKMVHNGKVIRGRTLKPLLVAWGNGPRHYCVPPAGWQG